MRESECRWGKGVTVFILCFFTVALLAGQELESPTAITVGTKVTVDMEFAAPEAVGAVTERVFSQEGASYISIHFRDFDLPDGDYVTVSDPDGNHSYRYEGEGKVVRGGEAVISDFWATHIPGDTAVVRFTRNSESSAGIGFTIDEWAHGFPEETSIESLELEAPESIEAICGTDQKEWAQCHDGTPMYERARAVARLLINGTGACTGWLVGDEGHFFTNEHCIDSQSDADNTDYEFMAERDCATDCDSWFACPGTVEASSGTLISVDARLDYAFIELDSDLSNQYGFLQLRSTGATDGEQAYIPQHPAGWGKQLALSLDGGTPCSIDSQDEPPCSGGGPGPDDVGYFCDTSGGSSGSPVIARTDHAVVALHHCANCPNRGVPIPAIIADLGNSLPASAIADGLGLEVSLVNTAPNDRLGNGETTDVVATVTDNGSAVDGRAVVFTSSSGLATVGSAPPTNPSGVTTATVTSHTSQSATVTITATVNGASDSVPVKVPDVSTVGFVVLLLALLLTGLAGWRARTG